jgi:hypothetical protein
MWDDALIGGTVKYDFEHTTSGWYPHIFVRRRVLKRFREASASTAFVGRLLICGRLSIGPGRRSTTAAQLSGLAHEPPVFPNPENV